MNSPFFSVVIPTHNRAELLGEAIRSVLDQSFRDFELIVVDDHSTDHTRQVVGSFNDSRVTCVLNDRARGGAGARNAGIFRAEGEWVAFLDDDDLWLTEKLELQYGKIRQIDNDTGLIYTGHEDYYGVGKQGGGSFIPEKEGWIADDLFCKNWIGTFSSVSIRTRLLRLVGGLDERFASGQDHELYVRIAAVSKVAFLKERLVLFRIHDGGRITDDMAAKLTARLLFREKYRHIIRGPRSKHFVASRIMVPAAARKNWISIIKFLPWTAAGLFVAPKNVYWTVRTVFSVTCNEKLKLFIRRLISHLFIHRPKRIRTG